MCFQFEKEGYCFAVIWISVNTILLVHFVIPIEMKAENGKIHIRIPTTKNTTFAPEKVEIQCSKPEGMKKRMSCEFQTSQDRKIIVEVVYLQKIYLVCRHYEFLWLDLSK